VPLQPQISESIRFQTPPEESAAGQQMLRDAGKHGGVIGIEAKRLRRLPGDGGKKRPRIRRSHSTRCRARAARENARWGHFRAIPGLSDALPGPRIIDWRSHCRTDRR
jgi:hypothetical protein